MLLIPTFIITNIITNMNKVILVVVMMTAVMLMVVGTIVAVCRKIEPVDSAELLPLRS